MATVVLDLNGTLLQRLWPNEVSKHGLIGVKPDLVIPARRSGLQGSIFWRPGMDRFLDALPRIREVNCVGVWTSAERSSVEELVRGPLRDRTYGRSDRGFGFMWYRDKTDRTPRLDQPYHTTKDLDKLARAFGLELSGVIVVEAGRDKFYERHHANVIDLVPFEPEDVSSGTIEPWVDDALRQICERSQAYLYKR